MREATFEVRVPADLLEFGLGQAQIQRHVTEWLVLSLFTEDHISSGKAAKLLNLTRVECLRLLRRLGILLNTKRLRLLPEIRPDLERLRRLGFSIRQSVLNAVLIQAGEK